MKHLIKEFWWFYTKRGAWIFTPLFLAGFIGNGFGFGLCSFLFFAAMFFILYYPNSKK